MAGQRLNFLLLPFIIDILELLSNFLGAMLSIHKE